MVFENVERLKREFTDKYVVVDESRPELRRFRGMTGTVKTVNMSGRALVQFDANNNIGWYDIELGALQVVDAPPPKPLAEERPAKKESPAAPAKTPAAKTPAAKAAPPTAAPAAGGKPAASPQPAGGAMSVAEMLAAARGEKGGGGATKSAVKPDAAKPAPAAAPAGKVDPKKMSVTEMLAAARGEKGGAKPATMEAAPAADDRKMSVAQQLAAARKTEGGKPEVTKAEGGKAPAKTDPKKMSVEQMLAAARAEKGGGSKPAPSTETEPTPAAAAPQAAAKVGTAKSAPAASPATASASKKAEIADVAGMLAYCRQVDAR